MERESGKKPSCGAKDLAHVLRASLEANLKDMERFSAEEFQRTKKIKPLKGTGLRNPPPKLDHHGGQMRHDGSKVVKELKSLLSSKDSDG